MLCRLCMRAGLGKSSSSARLSIHPNNLSRLPQRQLSSTSRLSSSSFARLSSLTSRNISSNTRPIAAPLPRFEPRHYSSSPAESAAAEPAAQQDAARLEKPDFLNEAESVIWDRLVAEFAPTELLVQDISGGCGSMYGIEVSSEKFRGTNMLKQQRMVNAVLADLMKGWHGVQLKTRAP